MAAGSQRRYQCRGLHGPWGAASSLPSLPQAQYRTTRGQSCHLTCHHTGGHTPDIKLHEMPFSAVSPSPLHFEAAFIKHHQSSETVSHWSPQHFETARTTLPCYTVHHEADSYGQHCRPHPSSKQRIAAVLNPLHRGAYSSRPASTSNHRNRSVRRRACPPPFHMGPSAPDGQYGAHVELFSPHRGGFKSAVRGLRNQNSASYKSSSTPRVRQPGTSNPSAYSRPRSYADWPFFITAQPNFGNYSSQQFLWPVPVAKPRLLPLSGDPWLWPRAPVSFNY